MRRAAREMRYARWLSGLAEMGPTAQPAGLVWVEDGRIVGNLTLIPFKQGRNTIHLIANVAVENSYRRKGIARALTQRAIADLRRKRESEVWLQVRADNVGAQALYRSAGFTDQLTRTTWRIRPKELLKAAQDATSSLWVRARTAGDWPSQKKWLAETYPALMRWNLPVEFNQFEPGGLQTVSNLLNGMHLRHWSVTQRGQPEGVVTWQRTSTFAHNLWLAMDPAAEAETLPVVLRHVLKHRPSNHPLSIDYPEDRHPEIFERLGFQKFRTLIWMRCSLK
jgi:ribosomal protein S18 acetylase RimI-like enzyme